MAKIPFSDFLRTDSKYSSMRYGFFVVLWFACILATITVLSSLAASFVGILGYKIAIDLVGILGILGPMFGFAFAGKSFQSFAEKSDTTTTTTSESLGNAKQ